MQRFSGLAKRIPSMAIAVLVGLMIGGAAVAIAAPDPGESFTGCLHKGKITDIARGSLPEDGECKKGEQVTWNETGPTGTPGPQGAKGDPGATGAQGEQGPPGESGATTPSTRWWIDGDGDGYGDFYKFLDSPVQPPGYVGNNLDCHDDRSGINPDVTFDDGSHGIPDADCDGVVGEDVVLLWFPDIDRDGYGDMWSPAVERRRSAGALLGHVRNGEDCNDGDAAATPYTIGCGGGANRDLDRDGHDAIEMGGDDCDDFDVRRYPGRAEESDGFGHDEDCNLASDGGFQPFDPWALDPRVASPDPAVGNQSPLQQAVGY